MTLFWLLSLSYLSSAIFYWGHLWFQNRTLGKLGFLFVSLGASIQTAAVIISFSSGKPIAAGIEGTLFLFSWFVALVFAASVTLLKLPVLGAFVAPLLLILVLPSIIVPEGLIGPNPSLANPWIFLHVSLVFLGEAIFSVAFIAGSIYIFEETRVKSKRVGSFVRKLPSLTKLDGLNHLCLLVGFPILSLGIAVGILSAKRVWGEFWKWDPKEFWALITWLLYAALIHGRLVFGWKGRKAAVGAILGFFAIIATIVVIGYFSKGKYGGMPL
jgi:cytochrome c-type biogenesis protein CcsB